MSLCSIQVVIKCLFLGFFPSLFLESENPKKRMNRMLAALLGGFFVYYFKIYEPIVIILYICLVYWFIDQKDARTVFFMLFSILIVCFYHAFNLLLQQYVWIESIALCMTYVLFKTCMPKRVFKASNRAWYCASMIALISILMYYFAIYTIHIDLHVALILWMSYGVKVVLLCYLGYRVMAVITDHRRLARLCKTQQQQEKLYAELKEANEINQSFRHDQANLVSTMHVLLADGQNRAKVLFDDCMKKTSTYCSVMSGNATLDWLLSSRQTQMNQHETIMQVYLNSALHEMSDHALVVILGNLLDNAMEAQAYVEDKRILVRTSQNDHHYYIKIQNRYSKEQICMKNDEYYSTKEDAKHHGIGLKNVRASIEELHGIFHTSTDDMFFYAFVCIPRAVLKEKR